MMNSIRNICRISCSQWINANNTVLPACSVIQRTYASNSKASHLYTTFMNSGTDLSQSKGDKKSHWLEYNDKVYPPQDPSEERRPAFVCHEIKNIKYSPKKMWYSCALVRGLAVDEALRQLKFIKYKGGAIATRLINEATELAVNEHNVEFKTNLWIAECFCVKGIIVKGVRRHAKGRIGMVSYRYVNVYIRLEEGQPPADYMNREDRSGPALLEKWLKDMRSRTIIGSL